jgi:hypothetical protein
VLQIARYLVNPSGAAGGENRTARPGARAALAVAG